MHHGHRLARFFELERMQMAGYSAEFLLCTLTAGSAQYITSVMVLNQASYDTSHARSRIMRG